METLIIKDGVAVYQNAQLGTTGTVSNGRFDPTTRTDNAIEIEVDSLPADFQIGGYTWDGSKLSPNTSYLADLPVDDVESKPTIASIASAKIAEIDDMTASAIQSGFDYLVDGSVYHFSYDLIDQQNFADAGNVANLIKVGIPNLPQEREWNAYKNWTPENGGELVELTFDVDAFIALYTGGALYHKATCMTEGAERKKAVADAVARGATVAEIQAI